MEKIVKAFIYFERKGSKMDLQISKYTDEVNKIYLYYKHQNITMCDYDLESCWKQYNDNKELSLRNRINYFGGTLLKGEARIVNKSDGIFVKIIKPAFPDSFTFEAKVNFLVEKKLIKHNSSVYEINMEIEESYNESISILEEYFIISVDDEANIENTLMAKNYERKQIIKKIEEYSSHENNKIDFIKESKDYQDYVTFFEKRANRELFDFQIASVKFHVDLQRTMNLSVPGSGKTTVALATIDYLMFNRLIDKVVVVTKKTIIPTWIEEIEKNIRIKHSIFEDRIYDNCINIINYEKDKQLLECNANFNSKTMFIFDEIHNIKNSEGKRNENYKKLSARSKYIIGLSGTPFPKGYEDVFAYSLLLKINFTSLRKGKDALHSSIKVSKEMLRLPAPKSDKIIPVVYNDFELETYKTIQSIKKDFYSKLYYLSIVSSGSQKLENFVPKEEIIETCDKDIEIESIDIELTQSGYSSKQVMLEKFITDFPKEKKIIIWTKYIATIDAVERVLKDLNLAHVLVHGRISDNQRQANIEKFKNGNINILVSNPACLGEGVSFHESCSDMLFYEKSLVLTEYLQAKERIHRLGMKGDIHVQNYHFVSKHELIPLSIEEYIQKKLSEKEERQNKIFNSAKIVLEEISPIDVIDAPINNID